MTTDQDKVPDTLTDETADQRRGPKHSFLNRLYTGTGAIEVVGKRTLWYRITGAIIAIALISIVFRGFTFGIDFEGGSRIQLPAADGVTEQAVENVFSQTIGHEPVSVQTVGSGSARTIQIRSEALTPDQTNDLQNALFEKFQPKSQDGTVSADAISIADVSETWGSQITQKALIALVVFLAIVAAYITFRFERFMAVAALSALVFDLTVTAGVYSLIGFEVTPATIIGMLTILGYSLYDTVVVFDKVDENTRGILHLTKRTYAEQANLALNQTLMRSINTTIIGIIPVVSMMIIAVWLLGVGTLKDLALVLLVGMIVGAYSSIFFATPLLVTLKEKWGPVAAHTKKVLTRRAAGGKPASVPAAAVVTRVRTSTPSAPRPGARPAGKRNKRRN